MDFYINGTLHTCDECGEEIMTAFEDKGCTTPAEDQETCNDCIRAADLLNDLFIGVEWYE